MTTHKHVGEPVSEWVVRVEPTLDGWDFIGFDNSDPPQLWTWRGEEGDESAEAWEHLRCPYQPGDVVEFWHACADCDTQASCVGDATVVQSGEVRTINDVPLCPEHCAVFGRKVCEDIIPSLRTVVRVEVRERNGWEWVVEVT